MSEGREGLRAMLAAAYRRAMEGDLEGAESQVRQVRLDGRLSAGASDSVEVMLVEGVVHTYRGEAEAARDRFRRVVALEPLLPQGCDAPSLAWGWRALLDYNAGDVLAAADAAAQACAHPERARPQTRLRAAMVLALLCEYAGLAPAARAWLAAARAVAPACRLASATGLMAYDLAAVRLAEAAVAHLRRPTPPDTARALLLQAQSAIHFDTATGAQVQQPLHDMVHAMALRLGGRAAEAVPLLERFLAEADCVTPYDRLSAGVELAACRMDTSPDRPDAACATELESALPGLTDPGERAHALALLARLATLAGDAEAARDWQTRFDDALAEHDERRSALAARLTTLGLTVVPTAWAVSGKSPE